MTITGHFGHESFQAIDCTDTDKQKKHITLKTQVNGGD